MAEASLNGQVNLHLAATKRDGVAMVQKSCLTQGPQAGQENASRFSVLQATDSSSSKSTLFSWLAS